MEYLIVIKYIPKQMKKIAPLICQYIIIFDLNLTFILYCRITRHVYMVNIDVMMAIVLNFNGYVMDIIIVQLEKTKM